jgi:hypothetical protein
VNSTICEDLRIIQYSVCLYIIWFLGMYAIIVKLIDFLDEENYSFHAF